jgi:hypothetical protein
LVLLIFCSWPHGPVAVRSLLTEIGVDLEEKPPNWRSSHRNPVFFLNFLTGGWVLTMIRHDQMIFIYI